jgi:hypothetical protein
MNPPTTSATRRTAPTGTRNAALQHELRALYCEDVMEILGIGASKAYAIIRQLNDELRAQGYITVAGRVSAAYFKERVYCGKGQSEPLNTGKTTKSK